MLERHITATRINEIINHPSIYPEICGFHTDPLDLSNVVKNPNHVCLIGEYGCFLFIKHQSGIYELHTSVLPEGRGEWTVEAGSQASHWMFTKTDAFELLTKCPQGNLAARVGAKMSGARNMFTTRPIWLLHGKLVTTDVYSLIIQEWIKNDKYVVESGKWFHKTLDLEYTKLSRPLSVHEEDEVHDRYVGATIEMIRGGQIAKAINFYNRWAIMSNYRVISVVSLDPLVIDISEARLKVNQDNFEVL